MNDILKEVYDCKDLELSQLGTAYIRARGADPLSSFGDFISLSRKVDVNTAELIRKMVSDGIIAPGFDDDALKLLKEKKGGKYLILQADTEFRSPETEFREVYGVGFSQLRNTVKINEKSLLTEVVTKKKATVSCGKARFSFGLNYTKIYSVKFCSLCIGWTNDRHWSRSAKPGGLYQTGRK